jgi:hypothetical protein
MPALLSLLKERRLSSFLPRYIVVGFGGCVDVGNFAVFAVLGNTIMESCCGLELTNHM